MNEKKLILVIVLIFTLFLLFYWFFVRPKSDSIIETSRMTTEQKIDILDRNKENQGYIIPNIEKRRILEEIKIIATSTASTTILSEEEKMKLLENQ